MKHILLIATGGTIASRPTENGLAPQLLADDILRCVPALGSLCRIDAVQPMNIDSTNMSPDCWLALAGCLRAHYDQYDGFVIAHGTDTMAYTACALSYLVQQSGKPIVLTGAQKSIYMQDTDARRNLYDAFVAAQDDNLAGVYIVFDGRVILGTRARKTRTKSMNAFSSIDYPDVALIRDGRILHYIRQPRPQTPPAFYGRLDASVFVLRLIPGMNPEVLRLLASRFDAGDRELRRGRSPMLRASRFSFRRRRVEQRRQADRHHNAGAARGQRSGRLSGRRAGSSPARHFAGVHDDR